MGRIRARDIIGSMKYLLIICFLALCLLVTSCSVEQAGFASETRVPLQEANWEQIFSADAEYDFATIPLGVILPHHTIAAPELNKFYKGLSKETQPDNVFVIGPNHFKSGDNNIQTCDDCIFDTPEGEVLVDKEVGDILVDENIASLNNKAFVQEHAISTHAPFVKKYFPDARINPIILNWKMPIDEVERFADELNRILPANSLVIASVDFSHYLSWGPADFHDKSSERIIQNFDYANIYDLEIDSPSSIYALLKITEARGYQDFEQISHTNSAEFLGRPIEETTSHQYLAFFPGETEAQKGVSFLDVGDLIETESTDLEYLQNIRGKEGRFLMGSDLVVSDLPDNECQQREQNNTTVSLCKFSGENLEKSKIKISEQNSDIIYVLIESNSVSQNKNLAKQFVSAGADIVIGRGSNKVESCEVCNGSVLCPSLGKFSSTERDGQGIVLGIQALPDGELILYPFFVEIQNRYLYLINLEGSKNRFSDFVRDGSWPDDFRVNSDLRQIRF